MGLYLGKGVNVDVWILLVGYKRLGKVCYSKLQLHRKDSILTVFTKLEPRVSSRFK
jgi:hypothetical protein